MVVKKPDQADVIDELAADAVLPDYPAGAPELLPYLQIRPRSRRAEFKRRFADFSDLQRKTDLAQKAMAAEGKTDDGDQAQQLRLWADMDDLYQLMDELMEMAAVDPVAYRKWSDPVEDAELTAVFQVFMKRGQPGEASRSAS